ncbi:MAG: phosphatidate cytidylyltransferase [Planctomycetota bacterium]|jgi:phosphatidate cytidylyltransferase|nr:phosphatidate cytidylyltransferase [Planctomycetota bacterium]
MGSELRNRLLFGPLLAAVALGLIATDILLAVHWGSMALAILVLLTATREYARLCRPLAPGVQPWSIAVVSVPLVLLVFPGQNLLETPVPLPGVLLSSALLLVCLVQMMRHGLENFTANVAATMLGIVYLGVSMHLLVALSCIATPDDPSRGAKLLVLTLATCKCGDIAAYFGGRAFGKHKLAPKVSPGKTWEGFVASLFGSVGGTFLFAWLLQMINPPAVFAGLWQPIVWGLILGPAGVIGDLVESCLKRAAGVKDSGAGLPGFGGYLDVFDAVLIAAPIACGLAVFL